MNHEEGNGRFICLHREFLVPPCARNPGSSGRIRRGISRRRVSWRGLWRAPRRISRRIPWPWPSPWRFSRPCALLRVRGWICFGLLVERLLLHLPVLWRVPKMGAHRQLSLGNEAGPQYRQFISSSGARRLLASVSLLLTFLFRIQNRGMPPCGLALVSTRSPSQVHDERIVPFSQ